MVTYMNSTTATRKAHNLCIGDIVTVCFFGGTQATGEVAQVTAEGFVILDHLLRVKYRVTYGNKVGDFAGLSHVEEAA